MVVICLDTQTSPDGLNADRRHTTTDHAERPSCAAAHIDIAAGPSRRATVVDPHDHGATIAPVGHTNHRAEWQRSVRRRQAIGIEPLSGRCAAALVIPGGAAVLGPEVAHEKEKGGHEGRRRNQASDADHAWIKPEAWRVQQRPGAYWL